MLKLLKFIFIFTLSSCSLENNSSNEGVANAELQNEDVNSDSLLLQLAEIENVNLDSITYSCQIVYPIIETSDSLKVLIVTRNIASRQCGILINNGRNKALTGEHPLLFDLKLFDENDSDLVYMPWAVFSSRLHIINQDYLEKLKSLKTFIQPYDSIVSEYYISKIVKYKGDQELPKGNYRLVLKDESDFSDTLAFKVIH